ncbi:MAG TPA: EamA/RhaT family transporter, partial [Thermopetrobacter sp.]|nr:EamA/RhaT family transporter [Thermopetrobacter sp.]
MADMSAEARAETTARGAWRGMALCALSMAVFAVQDAVTRTLVGGTAPLDPAQIMSVRLWVFAAVTIAWAARRGRLVAVFRPARPGLQAVRALLSALEMVTVAWALKYLGLAETHALFASFPLMAVPMAAVFLGERIDGGRLLAVLAG